MDLRGHRNSMEDSAQAFPPQSLRHYALAADGERGALIGPRGEMGFLCAPRWHDDAIFSVLLGGAGHYAVTPVDGRMAWGGHYDQHTLIWRNRWVTTSSVIECSDALAVPAERDLAVVLRRVEAPMGAGQVRVSLECRAGFGAETMDVRRTGDGVWEGTTGSLRFRWTGAPDSIRLEDGVLVGHLEVPEGHHHDLVLEIGATLPDRLPDAVTLWERTQREWCAGVPDLDASAAPEESRHSHAVLRGLTSGSGALVAAATTALPERAEQGRNYDYRYAWIRDQCFTGIAAAAVGDDSLLDAAVRFVSERVLEDGPGLKPAYTVDGGHIPGERKLDLPGYPGGPVVIGNRVNEQFQLDSFGEGLTMLAAADEAGRLTDEGRRAVGVLVDAIAARWKEPDAGIWELGPDRWAHSRLACAAGLRAAARRGLGRGADEWERRADDLVASADDCLHPSGRWQRSPTDPRVDAALLLPGIRGAVPTDDPRWLRTVDAVIEDLSDDGYVYRFHQVPDEPLHAAEGAFVLSGFHLAMAKLQRGERETATRWFDRNRSALGPPGLFAEEYDVEQRQLRGNLPQAFVHAVLLETARRLYDAGTPTDGFNARDR